MKRWTKSDLQRLREKTVAWFQVYGRPLPWRATRNPYRIWVSEIMLQQTVVAAVIPYYHKFLSTFPDILSLADADEQIVLQHWAGLGYYRRAKQLHAAAKVIRDSYNGIFPSQFREVLALPGIGRYTAGAILSFAFDQRYAIVEANTQRLYARLLRLPGQMTDRTVQNELWDFAESFLPNDSGSGEVNQAVMELGSQICTPRSPRCDLCPVVSLCPTHAHKEQEQIPTPKPTKVYEERQEAVLLLQNSEQRFLMRRCGPKDRWAGLWDFPRYDITDCQNASDSEERLQKLFSQSYGFTYRQTAESSVIKHGVTKYKITLRCIHGLVCESLQVSESKPIQGTSLEHKWCTLTEISELPLNSTGKKLLLRLSQSDVTKPKRVGNHKDTRKTHR